MLEKKDTNVFLNELKQMNHIIDIIEYEETGEFPNIFSSNKERNCSETDFKCLAQYPWIIYEMCTMYFYSAIYGENRTNDIIGTMLYSKSDLDEIFQNIAEIFKETRPFKIIIGPEHIEYYRVDVRGLTLFGKTELEKLNKEGIIPKTWREMYLAGRTPLQEEDGFYIIHQTTQYKNIKEKNLTDDLINVPFFRSIDISNLALEDCEQHEMVQKIITQKRDAFIFVDTHNGHCLKKLCWST